MKKSILLALFITASFLTANAQYTMLSDFTGDGAYTGAYPQYDQNFISDGTFLYGMTSQGGTNNEGTIFKIMPDGTGYVKLFDFTGANGRYTSGSLISDGTFLYGMTYGGGTNDMGVLFKIMSDGTGYSKLLDFAGAANGSNPYGSLISDGTFLYGMTSQGGTNNEGTIFKIMPDGTGYSKLLDFAGAANGGYPFGSIISDGTFLYGMTSEGGTANAGVLFKIMPDGTGYSKLLDFAGAANGGSPYGSLISDGTFLYGMTSGGGTNNVGVIFKIMPDGTGYSKLLDFAGAANGGYPYGSLISDGTFLYGMTSYGGTNDMGVLFKIMPDGTGYSKLLDYTGAANGSNPMGYLYSDGTFLYGMTFQGGTNLMGVIFKIMPDGTGYSKLLDFAGAVNGRNPWSSLISDGTFLYGMTWRGGTNDMGVIFKIMPDGTGYSKLLDFAGASNGSNPEGSLISDGTFLYGMTCRGGTANAGVLFKIMPDGTGYVKLVDFISANGRYPGGSLISDGTFLYGMTWSGGTNSMGVLFKIMPDGTGYSKLLDFAGAANGRNPDGSLISDGTFLYGMTMYGGTNDMGVIFKIMPDGTGYSKLLDFAGAANGGYPDYGSLISDGTFLYGMTSEGGTNDMGVIFKIMPDGTGYSKLLDFAGAANGSIPNGSLISEGPFLYGMTTGGGTANGGVLFKIMSDGTGYSKLLDFAGASNGGYPYGSLISDGTFLYGMTYNGGTANAGTVFKYQYCVPVFLFNESQAICSNQTFNWHGNIYNIPGIYYDSLITSSGCDSIYVLDLSVNPVYFFAESDTVCSGDSIPWHGNTLNTAGVYYDSLLTVSGCDSVYEMTLLNNPVYTFNEVQTICLGNSYNWHSNLYTVQGIYYDSLLTDAGCDSIFSLDLIVDSSYLFNDNFTLCNGQVYNWHNTDYSVAGIYYDSLYTAAGCDSIYILTLDTSSVFAYSETLFICNGQTFNWHGLILDTAGVYYDSLVTSAGCDSVYALTLNVNPVYNFIETDTICSGDSILWHGSTFLTAGIYYDSSFTTSGCDSIYELILNVAPGYLFNEIQTMCDGQNIIWHNDTLSSAGTYYDSLITLSGCDSIFVLDLSVNPVYFFAESDTVCSGDSIPWHGNTLYTAGVYYDSLLTVSGCDSVYEMTLLNNPVYVFNEVQTICSGNSFIWHGNLFTIQGVYYDSLLTGLGCDSVYSLDLIVDSVYLYNENFTLCNGQTYNWHGNDYTSAGVYYDSLLTSGGCDSIYILTLNTSSVYAYSETQFICSGQTYNWHGNPYTSAGVYYDSLLTTGGCDSIFALTLNVNPAFFIAESQTICDGQNIIWHGITYLTAGIYYDSSLTTSGCDSIYELTLNVNPVYVVNDNASICDGDSIFLAGSYQYIAGIYNDSLQTIMGCDSVIVMQLSVNPLPSALISGSDSLCIGDSSQIVIELQGTPPWDVVYTNGTDTLNENAVTVTSFTIIVSPVISQTYTLVSVVDANVCAANSLSGSAGITVFNYPVVNAGADGQVCGLTFNLNASIDAGNGLWNGPSGTSYIPDSISLSTQVTVVDYGMQYFTFNGLNGICASADTVFIVFYEQPVNVFAGNDVILENVYETNLNASIPDIGTGMWTIISGTGQIEDTLNPYSFVSELSLLDNTFRWIVVNSVCDSIYDDVIIHVNDMIIPTGFSPNGNLKNDYFTINGLEKYGDVKIIVYNRLGVQVYIQEVFNNMWDSKNSNGDDLPEDYYFYVIMSGNDVLFNGYVLIKR